ncbi:hypothetical protein AAG906_035214 [Vitis piasezkii]
MESDIKVPRADRVTPEDTISLSESGGLLLGLPEFVSQFGLEVINNSFGTSIAHWGGDIMLQVEKLKAENASLNEESFLHQDRQSLRPILPVLVLKDSLTREPGIKTAGGVMTVLIPRNTICAACYENARSIVAFINKFENDKGFDKSNNSTVFPANSSKGFSNALKWVQEMKEIEEELNEKLSFLGGFAAAFGDQIHTHIEIFKNMLDSDGCKAAPSNTITLPKLNHEELDSLLEFLYNGAMTAGQAYEAMNNAGHLDSDMIVILNDHRRVSLLTTTLDGPIPPVGALSSALNSGSGSTLFEELGLYYIGHVDGHNIDDLVAILKEVKSTKTTGPVLIHAIVEKGRRYPYAEKDAYHQLQTHIGSTPRYVFTRLMVTPYTCFDSHLCMIALSIHCFLYHCHISFILLVETRL